MISELDCGSCLRSKDSREGHQARPQGARDMTVTWRSNDGQEQEQRSSSPALSSTLSIPSILSISYSIYFLDLYGISAAKDYQQTHGKHEGHGIVMALSETRTTCTTPAPNDQTAQFHWPRRHTTRRPQACSNSSTPFHLDILSF